MIITQEDWVIPRNGDMMAYFEVLHEVPTGHFASVDFLHNQIIRVQQQRDEHL